MREVSVVASDLGDDCPQGHKQGWLAFYPATAQAPGVQHNIQVRGCLSRSSLCPFAPNTPRSAHHPKLIMAPTRKKRQKRATKLREVRAEPILGAETLMKVQRIHTSVMPGPCPAALSLSLCPVAALRTGSSTLQTKPSKPHRFFFFCLHVPGVHANQTRKGG